MSGINHTLGTKLIFLRFFLVFFDVFGSKSVRKSGEGLVGSQWLVMGVLGWVGGVHIE